jgi:hypothetical protein
MLPSFLLHPALLVRWHIYSKDRLLPFDHRVCSDINSALVLSVLIILLHINCGRYSSLPRIFTAVSCFILAGVKFFMDMALISGSRLVL